MRLHLQQLLIQKLEAFETLQSIEVPAPPVQLPDNVQ